VQVKLLTQAGIPTFQLVLVRSIINGLLNVVKCKTPYPTLPPPPSSTPSHIHTPQAQLVCTGGRFYDLRGVAGSRATLLLRGATGVLGFAGGYLSIELLSISDATVLRFTSPLWYLTQERIATHHNTTQERNATQRRSTAQHNITGFLFSAMHVTGLASSRTVHWVNRGASSGMVVAASSH
jgi:hypothetical protein